MHVRTALFSGRQPGEDGGGLFARRRRPRFSLLLAIIVAHLLLIAWLITRPAATPVAERGTVLALTAFAPDRPPSKPPPPAVVRQLVKPVLIVPAPQPAADIDPSPAPSPAVAGLVGQCQLAADAQVAILRNPAAMAELASLPPGLRTEADAVMLWNGGWADLAAPAVPGASAAEAPSQLKGAIVEAINSASPACRDGPVTGPLFIPVPEATRTTLLVIGSGVWRWADLLDPAQACVVDASGTCPKPAADRPIF